MEQPEKIKKIISDSSAFAIFLKENPTEQEFLCAQALATAFFFNECAVYQLSPLPESLLQKWEVLIAKLPNDPLPQVTSIKIPASNVEIKEIDYEKSDGFFNLRINSSGKLDKAGISIDQQPAEIDLVFLLGEIPPPKINYKNLLSLVANEQTVSEKTLEIVKEIKLSDPEAQKKTANLLLASLIVETENFTRHFSPHTLEAGKALLEMGADKKTVSAVLEKAKATPLTQLLGRAMARTRTDEDGKISWTFLSQEDFEKSGGLEQNTETLLQVMQKVRSLMPAQPTMIMTWQDVGGIEVMIKNFDDSEQSRQKMFSLAQRAACPMQNDFFVMGPFKNFTEAETQTQKMLKEENF